MSYAFVQQAAYSATGTSNSVAVSITGVTAGNTLIVATDKSIVSNTIADTAGNSWTSPIFLPAGFPGVCVFVCQNAIAGSTTATISWTGSADRPDILIQEFSGLATSGGVLASAYQEQNGNAPNTTDGVTSTTATVGTVPAMIWGITTTYNTASSPPADAGTGFTGRTPFWVMGGAIATVGMTEDMLVTSTGSYAATFTPLSGYQYNDIITGMIALPVAVTVTGVPIAWFT